MGEQRKPKDAVVVTIGIVEAATPGVSVSDEIPDPRPAQFYVLSRIGGGLLNPAVDAPRMLIECWAENSTIAGDMGNAVVAELSNAKGKTFNGGKIVGCDDIQGPTDYNDPDIQDRRRSQVTCTLYIRTD